MSDENTFTPLPPSLKTGIQIIKDVVRTLSLKAGVYRMIDQKGDILYIGKAKNLKNRVSSYTQPNRLSNRLQRMVSETVTMEVVTTQSEVEALLLESNLIKKLQPKYNILLRDDKSFPSILITQDHPFPRIAKHRGQQTIKGLYFGPFASGSAVEETLILIQKVFQLRNCSDSFFAARTRPCLQYHIKRCTAPCVRKVTEKDYAEQVKQALAFLSGKSDQIQKYLAEKMHRASDALAYEEAAAYRDRLRILTKIQTHQRINVQGIKNADIIAIAHEGGQTCVQLFFFRQGQNYGTESFFMSHTAQTSLEEQISAFITQFYQDKPPAPLILLSHRPFELSLIGAALQQQHGQKVTLTVPKLGKKLELVTHALANAKEALARKFSEQQTFDKIMDQLTSVFQLPKRPERIEVYDNSHLQGTHPYGAMIVAGQRGFEKKLYRKFTIKSAQPSTGGDDYAMMREVLQRRFARAEEIDWTFPDLILVDGGLGQLNVALEVIKELDVDGITVIGIAKGPDRNAGRERFFKEGSPPFTLEGNPTVLHFVQRLRDEAHRFAIGTHRAGRQKNLTKSLLDDIPGIGAARKRALLKHFGSARAVKGATLQDLQIVPGISKSVATKIHRFFNEG